MEHRRPGNHRQPAALDMLHQREIERPVKTETSEATPERTGCGRSSGARILARRVVNRQRQTGGKGRSPPTIAAS